MNAGHSRAASREFDRGLGPNPLAHGAGRVTQSGWRTRSGPGPGIPGVVHGQQPAGSRAPQGEIRGCPVDPGSAVERARQAVGR